MPRISPFEIRLSREDRRVLEATARRYSSSYREVVRAKVVLLAAEGLSNQAIAARVDLPARSCPSGESDSSKKAWPAWRSERGAAGPRSFPPEIVVAVKAIACELPARLGMPLSRLHVSDIRTAVIEAGLVAEISGTTIWRWLAADAIRPWCHRSWIFPRDPDFEFKAGRALDLYERRWGGKRLRPDEYVISADEKTSIQARIRLHETTPPAPGQRMRLEHEYERGGSLAYLAAWDVHRAKLFGQTAATTGIASFDRLVAHVMGRSPYRGARRVFWIVDNGSSHRGEAAVNRLAERWPNLVLVHLPIHASWLNQIEIYFSIVQRKVLTPCDFPGGLPEVARRLISFQKTYERAAEPFEWKFTRADLGRLMRKLQRQRAAA